MLQSPPVKGRAKSRPHRAPPTGRRPDKAEMQKGRADTGETPRNGKDKPRAHTRRNRKTAEDKRPKTANRAAAGRTAANAATGNPKGSVPEKKSIPAKGNHP